MKDLHLLFFTKDFQHRMEKSSEYLREELSKRVHLTTWQEDGQIEEILSTLQRPPDAILLNDFKPDYSPRIYGLESIHVPKAAIVHDLDYRVRARTKFYKEANIDGLFAHYEMAFRQSFPTLISKFQSFPHHVPIERFCDWKLPRATHWLLSGANFPHLYPDRYAFSQKLQGKPGFVQLPHPGYGHIQHPRESMRIGEEYIRALNETKMHVTCDSKKHYPLLKYFETLACNTLLLATPSDELTSLGFMDGETFVAVDQDNVVTKCEEYLLNEENRLQIAQRGYEYVREYHSTSRRVTQLMEWFLSQLN
ncbi:glycosyltransferase [Bacillus fonticola]|uniref:glycosyltransferase n=1 Tax=Bacillus fonticola TaxID=2728853 RepID=UPI001473FEAB|nr:glycosyltransferase [Bacillus fonticola]